MRREYPKRPIAAAGALIRRGEEVLLVLRSKEPGKGRWSIPGGMIELGEKAKDTVVREVEEELGLKVKVDELLDIIDMIDRDQDGRIRYHYVIIDYTVHPIGGRLKLNSECDDARWFRKDELKSLGLTRTARKLLKKIGYL